MDIIYLRVIITYVGYDTFKKGYRIFSFGTSHVRSRPCFKPGSPNPFTYQRTLNRQPFDVVTWRMKGIRLGNNVILFHPTRPETSLTRTNHNRQLAIVHAFQTTSQKAKAKRPEFFASILGFHIQRNAGYHVYAYASFPSIWFVWRVPGSFVLLCCVLLFVGALPVVAFFILFTFLLLLDNPFRLK
jgi:hypothetical protein